MRTGFTHEQLVKRARAWIHRTNRPPLILSELVSGPETADVIGIDSHKSVLVECKASRSDFLADRKKHFRQFPEHGMGDERYYLCPPGMIKPEEVPVNWGLLYTYRNGVTEIKKAVRQPKDIRHEVGAMLSLIRRIGKSGPNVSVRVYTWPTLSTAVAIIAEDGQR